jgi:hypothetical protein
MPAAIPIAILGAAAITAGVGMYNAHETKVASRRAARAQTNAAKTASDTQLEMFNKSQDTQQPWIDTGKNALAQLNGNLQAGEYGKTFGQNFDWKDYGEYQAPGAFQFSANDMAQDPGVKFRMDAANQALERSASAKGGTLGGGQLRALSTLNQGLASQEFGNAYSRARGAYDADRTFGANLFSQNRDAFNANQSARYGIMNDSRSEFYNNQANSFNRLASIANVGQVGAGNVSAQQNALGQALANNALAAGNSRASGIMGAQNAQNQGYATGANALQNAAMMYAMFGGGGGGAGAGSGMAMNGGFA